MKLPSIVITPCLIIGILLARMWSESLIVIFAFSILSLFLVIFCYKYFSLGFWLFLSFSIVLLGAISIKLNDVKYKPKEITSKHLITKSIVVEKLKSNAKYNRYVLESQWSEDDSKTIKILTYISKNKTLKTPIDIDDVIIGKLRLNPIVKPLNPNQFDYKKYLSYNNIYLQTYITKDTPLHLIKSKSHSLHSLAQNFKYKMRAALIKSDIKKDNIAVVEAIFFGEKTHLSKKEYNNFKNAGIAHILAVSGLHVGIIFFLISFLFKPLNSLPNGRLMVFIIIIFCLWSYAGLVGFTPSITRAVIMFSFYSFSQQINRRTNSLNTLLSAMFITLLIDPLSIYNVGFQMSYLAVASIIIFKPLVDKKIKPKSKILKHIWDIISISIIVQLGILPISLLYFHQFSGIFIIANLGALIFLEIYMGIGFFTIILSLVGLSFSWLINVFNFLTKMLRSLADWAAHQESLIFKNVYFDTIFLILIYFSFCSLYFIFKRFNFLRTSVFLISIILCQTYVVHKINKRNKIQKLIIFNTKGASTIGCQIGGNLQIFTSDSSSLPVRSTIRNYIEKGFIKRYSLKKLHDIVSIESTRILCVDNPKLYHLSTTTYNPNILLIQNGVKINPERFIKKFDPKMIILDGSNPKYYNQIWYKIYQKSNPSVYNTSDRGALVINF